MRILISWIFAPLAILQATSAHQVLLSNICVHQDITAAPILAGLLHVQQAPTALLGERHPAHAKLVHLDITALRVQFNLLFVQLATFVEILWTWMELQTPIKTPTYVQAALIQVLKLPEETRLNAGLAGLVIIVHQELHSLSHVQLGHTLRQQILTIQASAPTVMTMCSVPSLETD